MLSMSVKWRTTESSPVPERPCTRSTRAHACKVSSRNPRMRALLMGDHHWQGTARE